MAKSIKIENVSSIKIVPKLSTHLDKAMDLNNEDVKLLITETFDSGFFGEHILETLDHAWKYLLHKEAKVIPSRAKIFGFLIESQNDLSNEIYLKDSQFANLTWDINIFNPLQAKLGEKYLIDNLQRRLYHPLSNHEQVRMFIT
jgi:hypothetical protein